MALNAIFAAAPAAAERSFVTKLNKTAVSTRNACKEIRQIAGLVRRRRLGGWRALRELGKLRVAIAV